MPHIETGNNRRLAIEETEWQGNHRIEIVEEYCNRDGEWRFNTVKDNEGKRRKTSWVKIPFHTINDVIAALVEIRDGKEFVSQVRNDDEPPF